MKARYRRPSTPDKTTTTTRERWAFPGPGHSSESAALTPGRRRGLDQLCGWWSAPTGTSHPPRHHIQEWANRSSSGVRYQTRTQTGMRSGRAAAPSSGSHDQPGRRPAGTFHSPDDRTHATASSVGGGDATATGADRGSDDRPG